MQSTRLATASLLLLLGGCSDHDIQRSRLATGCINASQDNRVKLSSAWTSSYDVRTQGDRIMVEIAVPVGLSIKGEIKFRHRRFECRRAGERIEFVSATWE